MKRLILILGILVFSYPLMAADTTNVAVSFEENEFFIMYYGTAYFKSDAGTDNCITQWMALQGVDFENYVGTLQIYCEDITGTEDVNGYIEFSDTTEADRFKSLATDGDLDQIQTTVVLDTVGLAEGVRCWGAKYMRLKLDGQSGNPHSTPVTWYIFCPKKGAPVGKRTGSVGDCE